LLEHKAKSSTSKCLTSHFFAIKTGLVFLNLRNEEWQVAAGYFSVDSTQAKHPDAA